MPRLLFMPRHYHYTKKAGRPTKYRPKYCRQVITFFQRQARPGSPMVTLLDFATSIPKVSVDAVFEWETKYPDFRQSVKTALRFQERQLTHNGLEGTWNPAMSIFLLKNNHHYSDRLEHTGPEGDPLRLMIASSPAPPAPTRLTVADTNGR